MFAEVKAQAYQTEEPEVVGVQRHEWLPDGVHQLPPRKWVGFAVEGRGGMKRICEAYQTATDTWVGAD